MNPHELASLSSEKLAARFLRSLKKQDVPATRDALSEIESRFQTAWTNPPAIREFARVFFPLIWRKPLEDRLSTDPLDRCVADLRHLIELAEKSAVSPTSEEVLRQVVKSRKRGPELIQLLIEAGEHGEQPGKIAEKWQVSAPAVSQLLTEFQAAGIIRRQEAGRNAFIHLSAEAQAVFRPVVPRSHLVPRDIEYGHIARPLRAHYGVAAA